LTDDTEPDAAPNDHPEPAELPHPKRGAFPSPREEIEKAKPFVPDSGEGEDSGTTPDPPDVDGDKEG
jgi:hypothetical protein